MMIDLLWIEVQNHQFIELTTRQPLTLHSYPMQAAQSGEMEIPAQYEGKTLLVTGDRAGQDIYSAQIKGCLLN